MAFSPSALRLQAWQGSRHVRKAVDAMWLPRPRASEFAAVPELEPRRAFSTEAAFATASSLLQARRQPRRFDRVPKGRPLCEVAPSGPGYSASAGDDPGRRSRSLVADVCYEPEQRILLLGEANFSFAEALAQRFEDCSALTATSLESRAELVTRFGSALERRLHTLEASLCGVHHGLPAAELPRRFRLAAFDRVCFNFPLCSSRGTGRRRGARGLTNSSSEDAGRPVEGTTARHSDRMRHSYEDLSALLDEFFRGAAAVLRPGGECHLRLTDQYATARGLQSAFRHGFDFVDRVDFLPAFHQVYAPLGYQPATVGSLMKAEQRTGSRAGRSPRSGFDVRHASTFVFRKSAMNGK